MIVLSDTRSAVVVAQSQALGSIAGQFVTCRSAVACVIDTVALMSALHASFSSTETICGQRYRQVYYDGVRFMRTVFLGELAVRRNGSLALYNFISSSQE